MVRTELKKPIYRYIKCIAKDAPFYYSKRGNYHIMEDDEKIVMVIKKDSKLWIDSQLYSNINNFFSLPLYEADELIIEAVKYGWNINCVNLHVI
jgi:hypothetical protein